MFKIELFKTFNSNSIRNLESLMFFIWLQYLIFDQYQNLHLLDSRLFYHRGVFRFFNLLNIDLVLNQYFVLITLRISLILLVLYFLYKRGRITFFSFLLLVYFYELIKKGFGGHIDHRIITLYLFTIIFYISNNKDSNNIQSIILPPYLFLIFQYFFIGFARLINGFPQLFIENQMSNWLIQRSLRQNYFNLEIGLLISNTFQPYILNLFLITTTALEISLILTLFTKKRTTTFLLLSTIATHVGIFLFMGINFIENVLLLLSFLYLTYKYEPR